jgi:sugar phosphate isomerase/epimerase
MVRIAFTTVAFSEWTLDRIAAAAGPWGYQGVDLRTFGYGSREFACDPALTDPAKVRETLGAAGVHAAGIATGCCFDEPIRPPVIGRVGDTEASIRRAKTAIEVAGAIGAPYVRVFAFQVGLEHRERAVERIVERLKLVADAVRNTGVKVVLENGGSFCKADEIGKLIDRVGSPLLGASYSIAMAARVGESPVDGLDMLGDRLWIVKIKDYDKDCRPCQLGEGVVPCGDVLLKLASGGFRGWAVFEWDRAWVPALAPAESILPVAAERMTEWIGQAATLAR